MRVSRRVKYTVQNSPLRLPGSKFSVMNLTKGNCHVDTGPTDKCVISSGGRSLLKFKCELPEMGERYLFVN